MPLRWVALECFLCLSLALRLRSLCALAPELTLAFALLPCAFSAALVLTLRVLSLCALTQRFSFSLLSLCLALGRARVCAARSL